MSEFDRLFDEGEKKALLAHNKIEEIEHVFLQLNESFIRKTDNKKEIVKVLGEPRNPIAEIQDFTMGLNSIFNSKRRYVDEGLAENKIKKGSINIVSKTSNKSKVIALWEMDPNGYPFFIKYMGVKTSCRDKEALEAQLGQIISSTAFWLVVHEMK